MEIFKRYKLAILGIIVALALFAAYTFYFGGNDEAALLLESGATGVSSTAADQELLALLLSLNSVELDDSIFDAPEFRSLVDFREELSPEPVGRTNPFAPF